MELTTHRVPSNVLTLLLFLLAATPVAATTRYITVVNDDFRTVVQVEVARVGSRDFLAIDIPMPLIGGREGQGTAVIPPGACRRDLRIVYRDANTLTVTGWDTCRQSVLHIGAAHQAALLHH